MSADRRSPCPKCNDPDDQSSLREDWQIGIDKESMFVISYEARCRSCQFHYVYYKQERVP